MKEEIISSVLKHNDEPNGSLERDQLFIGLLVVIFIWIKSELSVPENSQRQIKRIKEALK